MRRIAGILFSVTLSAQSPEIERILLTLEPSWGGGKIRPVAVEVKKARSLFEQICHLPQGFVPRTESA